MIADQEQVAAFLEEAAELTVRIVNKEISIDQYVETVERLKEDLPEDRVAEMEVVIQLASFMIVPHQAAVADNVGTENGGQFALDIG